MSAFADDRSGSSISWLTLGIGLTVFAFGFVARGIAASALSRKITSSPRTLLLPGLSEDEKKKLPYPPDALPGARDVLSPYGTIRVYEWGPEDGRKVLFVHGISTPCLALGAVAQSLMERGCRVMLFDLYDFSFILLLLSSSICSPLFLLKRI